MTSIITKNLVAAAVVAIAVFSPPAVQAQDSMHINKEKLQAHTAEFNREVIQVTDGVYVAVGFGLANSILIEGDDGVIIVDVMESEEAAREVKAEFDKITTKPVRAIIYTHNHTDHIMGATVFAGDGQPDVYSHETTTTLVDNIYKHITGAIFSRSVRQFGVFLPPADHINCGIGPRLRVGAVGGTGFIPANRTFSDVLETEIAGVKVRLVHAPGETDDQLYVWLPEKRVLLPGDNFYKAFPNLYAIRGTSYRDVRHWADSLDLMIAENPRFLVPSHSRPIEGESEIRETLGNYRDAIRFIHDETVAGMNRGLTPDQLVETVKLPPHLAEMPYLEEYYGTVAWSVRSIFSGYLGWFDGNATNLSPLSTRERALRIAELAGGEDELTAKATAALAAGDFQWCAELADLLIALSPENAEAKRLRAAALRELGERQISANGRNYYLTSAQQTR